MGSSMGGRVGVSRVRYDARAVETTRTGMRTMRRSGPFLAAMVWLALAAGCAPAHPGAPEEAPAPHRLARGPFIQYLTPGGAAVEWTALCAAPGHGSCSRLVLDPPATGEPPAVEVVRERGASEARGAGSLADHRVEVRGLEAGRQYPYSIVAEDGADLSQTGEPPTALGPLPSPERLRFAVLGDTGSGSTEQYGIAHVLEREVFDFGFIAGDLVAYPEGEKDYDERYFEPYRAILARSPLYPILGNHDIGAYWPLETSEILALAVFDVFRRSLPEEAGFHGPPPPRTYYSLAVGPALFVALDSTDAAGGDLYLPAEEHGGAGHESCQWNWLRAELARPGFEWKFVLLHHPPFSSGLHAGRGGTLSWPTYALFHSVNGVGWAWNGLLGWTGLRVPRAPVASDLKRLRASLADLFAAGGVDVVFTSHDHDFEISRPIRGFDEEREEPIYGRGPTGTCPATAAEATRAARPTTAAEECVYERREGPIYVVTGGGGRPLRPVARSAWTVTSFSDYHAVFVELAGQSLALRVEPQGLRYAMR